MLAKVISYAPTRRQAAMVLADALTRSRLHGVRTNRDLLVNVLRHPAFLDGATDTAFFDTHGLADLAAPLADAEGIRLSAIAAALADAAHNRATATVFGSIPSGWRNLASGYLVKTYLDDGGTEHRIEYRFSEPDWCFPVTSRYGWSRPRPTRSCWPTTKWTIASSVARYDQDVYVDSPRGPVHLVALPRFPSRDQPSKRVRWWRPCPATSSGWALRSAIP